jgi:hypothetical protein
MASREGLELATEVVSQTPIRASRARIRMTMNPDRVVSVRTAAVFQAHV